MSDDSFNVFSMNNVVPIRPGLPILPVPTRAASYLQETADCQRYEIGKCRVCMNPREEFSPWCVSHFPWHPEERIDFSEARKTEVPKVPKILY